MAFITFKTIVLFFKKTFLSEHFLFCLFLLLSLVNYRSLMTLFLLSAGASVQNLKGFREFVTTLLV